MRTVPSTFARGGWRCVWALHPPRPWEDHPPRQRRGWSVYNRLNKRWGNSSSFCARRYPGTSTRFWTGRRRRQYSWHAFRDFFLSPESKDTGSEVPPPPAAVPPCLSFLLYLWPPPPHGATFEYFGVVAHVRGVKAFPARLATPSRSSLWRAVMRPPFLQSGVWQREKATPRLLQCDVKSSC